MAWVGNRVARYRLATMETVEVGSLNVNGSCREFFRGPYIGLDMRDGPGVDVVGFAAHLPFETASADVVICTEVLEHDPSFWATLDEIGRILRPRGHLLLTTRGNGFGEHREPEDLWRFMPDSRRLLADLASCDLLEEALDPEVPGVFVHGRRR
jgi:SAM-dependent methyltransferase